MGFGANEVSPPELEEIARKRREKQQHKWKKEEEVEEEEDGKTATQQRHAEVKIPGYVGSTLTFLLVFFMAATIRGEPY